MESAFSEKLYTGATWLVRLAYLQLLFFLYVLVGLGVFGVFPSLTATMATVRQWLNSQDTDPLHKTFSTHYKNYFLSSNLIGLLITLGTTTLLLYVYWFAQLGGAFANIYVYIVYLLLFIALLIWGYWIPVLVHYKIKKRQIFKYSLFIGFTSPFHTVALLILTGIICLISIFLPGIIPIFSVVLLVTGWTWITQHAFKTVDRKANKTSF